MKRLLVLATLFAWLASGLPGFALGLIVVPDHEGRHIHPPRPVPPIWPAPRPLPPRHEFAPLEMVSAKVTTRINDQIATTKVEQEFSNPGDARLEGTFLFPVPAGAQLDKFTMEIDGKPVEAELLAADKARGIYEDIVRRMRDPALLEYSGRDVFKVRIFPIEPRSRKRVTLTYSQLLKADAGLMTYTLPLNPGKFSAAPIKSVSVRVELESPRPLKTIYSPSHTVEIKRDGASRAVIGYEASDLNPETDFALCFSAAKDELGVNLLTSRVAGEEGFFVLLAAPGVERKEKTVVAKDVVFVLDTSGSMAGRKLEQAKKALQFCVENLNAADRFEVVRFSTEVEPLFTKLVAADAANRTKAQEFIKDLRPMGGTAIDDALRAALALRPDAAARPFVVIFLTDGQPTIGTTDEETIVANAKRGAGSTRVFCFGIGTDVNTRLLDRITEATRAFSQYVLPEEDLEVKLSNFFAKIKEPVLANPTLKFTGDVRATKIYPQPLPDIFKGEQLVVAGRYSGSGPAAVIIEGTVNGQVQQFTYEVKFPAVAAGQEFVPRLWATRRVGFLLDEIRLRGENAELKEEVTDLARRFGLVTPYTAYLIVEDEAKRNVPTALQSLPQLRDDRAARELSKSSFDSLSRDKGGDAGVANARSAYAFRAAAAPGVALSESRTESRLNLAVSGRVGGISAATGGRLEEYTQQQKFAGRRNFYQNGSAWVDAEVQRQPEAPRVRLQFGSPEYFAFAATNSAARPWLALGTNVQFVLDGKVYEVSE